MICSISLQELIYTNFGMEIAEIVIPKCIGCSNATIDQSSGCGICQSGQSIKMPQ